MQDPTPDSIVVMMTASSREEATRIATLLVERKLAACVQILPGMQSIYTWKGQTHRDDEVLMLAKSIRENFAQIEREVRAMHSYETPEIIALPIVAGSEDYLKWLTSSCEGS